MQAIILILAKNVHPIVRIALHPLKLVYIVVVIGLCLPYAYAHLINGFTVQLKSALIAILNVVHA